MIARQSFLKARALAHATAICAMTIVVSGAYAAGPLDFGYAVDGPPAVRPSLIFNDGRDTYIQPAQGIPTTVKGSVQEGPYLRVPGLSSAISLRAGRYSMTATRTTPPSPAVEAPNYAAAPVQANAAYAQPDASGRQARRLESPPAQIPPLLGPSVASPDKNVALASTVAGQPAASLVAGPVVFSSTSAARAETAEIVAARIASANALATASQPTSLLASNFSATAIRDSDASHTQIRFAEKPPAELAFTSADGHSLNPSWDYGAHVVTIDRAARFTVTDGKTVVEVARVLTSSFDFDVDNPVQLEAVFTKGDATYFKFSPKAKHVHIVDGTHMAKGEQKGRYYKIAYVGDQFTVSVGGKSITVNRKEAVAYYDRPGKQS